MVGHQQQKHELTGVAYKMQHTIRAPALFAEQKLLTNQMKTVKRNWFTERSKKRSELYQSDFFVRSFSHFISFISKQNPTKKKPNRTSEKNFIRAFRHFFF